MSVNSQKVQDFFQKHPWLREVVEITYAYEKRGDFWWNKTLFDILLDGHEWAEDALQKIIDSLVTFSEELSSEWWISKIVGKYCIYASDMVMMAKLWLPFEREKAWIDNWLNETSVKKVVIEIEKIEQRRFWKKVMLDTFESSRVVYYLKIFLETLADKNLSWEEKKLFESYLESIKEKSAFDKEFLREDENEWIMDDQEFFLQEIPRDVYAQIFTHAMRFYGIQKPVIIDSRSSMYDGLDALYIPDSDTYATMPLQRIIELIQHEIEVHYLVQENTAKLLPITDGANSLFREEWLAKFMEEIINWATIASMDISSSLYQILPCEIFSWEQLEEFLKLYWKLKGQCAKREGQLLRRKRNYPLSHPGWQHKDVTYSRGRFMVRGYLMNGWDFTSLYNAKVDFEDMKILDESMSEELKKSLLHCEFLAERMLYHFLESTESFKDYLVTKYPFINFSDYPKIEITTKQEQSFEAIMELLDASLSIKEYQWPSQYESLDKDS